MALKEYREISKVFEKKGLSSYGSDRDDGKDTIEHINERDDQYTELLESYVGITKWRNRLKEFHKWVFFWLVIVACIYGLILAYRSINAIIFSGDKDYVIESIPIIIAAFVSFASTVIAVPLAITNFLFNSKEDDNITELIKHTQEHDAGGRELLRERFLHHVAGGQRSDTLSANNPNTIASD